MTFNTSLAQQNYSIAQSQLGSTKHTPPKTLESAENSTFKTIHELASTVAEGEKKAIALTTGGADPHSVIEAIATAELAVETATTVRDKAIEAFQELLRMPI